MKAEIKEKGAETILLLDGRLDTASAPDVEATIQPLLQKTGTTLVVDCSALSYISSSGLRIFITLQKSCIKNANTLTLKTLSPELKDVFDMTGLSALFTINE